MNILAKLRKKELGHIIDLPGDLRKIK